MVVSLDKVPSDSEEVELKISLRDTQLKTSDWILQEIGYASGQDMRIILLLEDGLRDAGELQGNLEHIPFKRESPEKSFPKILQMISTMRPSVPSSGSATKSIEPTPFEPTSTKPEEEDISKLPEPEFTIPVKPQESWKYDDYFLALIYSMHIGDNETEELIHKVYLDVLQGQDEEKTIKWHALRFYHRLKIKRSSDLGDIIKLARDNPKSYAANRWLAKAYELYEEYSKAGHSYLEASKCADEVSDRFMALRDASVAFAKDGDMTSGKFALEEAKDLADEVDDAEIQILFALLHLYPLEDDVNNYLCFMERMVDIKPDDNDRRFALAYKYGELNRDRQALFHYRVLSKQRPTETIWNNSAVAEANLNLPAKAVRSYRESVKLGGTLAMSNLAYGS